MCSSTRDQPEDLAAGLLDDLHQLIDRVVAAELAENEMMGVVQNDHALRTVLQLADDAVRVGAGQAERLRELFAQGVAVVVAVDLQNGDVEALVAR